MPEIDDEEEARTWFEKYPTRGILCVRDKEKRICTSLKQAQKFFADENR
jgi:hypothetical protein